MKNILLYLSLFLTLSSCQNSVPNYNFDEPNLGVIEGKVFDFDSKKPLNNIKFYLLFNQTNVVDSIFSDTNGNFKATFLSFDYWDHQLEVVLPPNYILANGQENYKFTGNEQIYLKK